MQSIEGAHQAPRYRADIDGLRGVAIVLVLLEHLRFSHFPGGYVGVDVFFVISGYLIGSSMLAEFRAGTFSLAAFYERRVRRIFPALLAVLMFTSVLAYHFLLAKALVTYARSLLTALFSWSNFFFWTQEGYFVSRSAKPLLHTWSLGVEEQFYILLPLLLYGVFRWSRRHVRTVLWALLAISFLAACVVVRSNPAMAFFWSPLRAWELLAGVMVSQYKFAKLRARWVRETAALVGLALIVYAGLHFSVQTIFPGWTAVVPCMGAALILAAGQEGGSGAASLLALPPVRFVGLISYSLYLWHWPFLVFQNTRLLLSDQPIRMMSTKLLVLAVSVTAATLSWWLVETPFRKGRLRPTRRVLFAITGVATVALAGWSVWMIRERGLPLRFSPEVQRLAETDSAGPGDPWRSGRCFLMPENTFGDFSPTDCLGRDRSRKTYLLYGDSTAAQLYPGLVKIFPEIHFQQATSAGCYPYRGDEDRQRDYARNCADLWHYLHGTYLKEQRPDAVILAGHWNGPDYKRLGEEIATFQQRGIPVLLVGPGMVFEISLPTLLAAKVQQGTQPALAAEELWGHRLQEYETLDMRMEALARDTWHVRYVSYMKELCQREVVSAWSTGGGCPLLLPGGEPLIFDTYHLSVGGSVLFARRARADGVLPFE